MAGTYNEYVETARRCIGKAQERMSRQANKHRRKPDFHAPPKPVEPQAAAPDTDSAPAPDTRDRVFIIKKT